MRVHEILLVEPPPLKQSKKYFTINPHHENYFCRISLQYYINIYKQNKVNIILSDTNHGLIDLI